MSHNNQAIFQVEPVLSTKNVSNTAGAKKFLIIIVLVFLATCLIIALVLTLVFLFVINKTTISCVANSTRIGNSCVCDYGYSGDGLNYCDECGITYYTPNVKIVGGIPANEKSWPSAALIIFSYKEDVKIPNTNTKITISFSSKCGGSLLNRDTILTAAHCILKSVSFEYGGNSYETAIKPTSYFPNYQSMYKVYLGVYNISILKNPLSISKIIPHEDYSEYTQLNDIAILKLSSPVTLNESIQITCLPNPSNGLVYPVSSPVDSWAVGWGTLSYLGKSPDVLHNVKLTVYDETKCSFVSVGVDKNWKSQICAGDLTTGKDTCQGDSGGSLFVKDYVNGKMKYVTAGIVSYGDECGKINSPGIYTRVSYYNNWIKQYL